MLLHNHRFKKSAKVFNCGWIRFWRLSERIQLPKLTVVEQYVISQACLLVSIIKLLGQQISERQSGKIGHFVVFPQKAKRLEEELERCRRSKNCEIFSRVDHVLEFISVAFIGTQAQWKPWFHVTFPETFRTSFGKPSSACRGSTIG